jgi:hypothetical protein
VDIGPDRIRDLLKLRHADKRSAEELPERTRVNVAEGPHLLEDERNRHQSSRLYDGLRVIRADSLLLDDVRVEVAAVGRAQPPRLRWHCKQNTCFCTGLTDSSCVGLLLSRYAEIRTAITWSWSSRSRTAFFPIE